MGHFFFFFFFFFFENRRNIGLFPEVWNFAVSKRRVDGVSKRNR